MDRAHGTELRKTLQTQLVLRELLHRARDEAYGYAIATRVGLPPGTVYRILGRLEVAGWVESRRERGDHDRAWPSRRCFWHLSAAGVGLARALPDARGPRADVDRERFPLV